MTREADAMKIATKAWYERITPQPTVHGKLEEFARALTEYGNQCAREARAVNEFIVEYGERRAREARAAAIEEAAQAIDGWSGDYSCEIECFSKWAKKTIRAVADTPPLGAAEHARYAGQSEGVLEPPPTGNASRAIPDGPEGGEG